MQVYDTTNNTVNKIKLFSKYLSGLKGPATETIIRLVKLSDGFKEKKDLQGEGVVNASIGNQYIAIGDFTNSLRYYFSALKIFEEAKDSSGIMYSLFAVGNAFIYAENFEQALVYLQKSVRLSKNYGGIEYADNLNGIAYCMIMLKKPDSAFAYIKPAINIGLKEKDTISLAYYYSTLGEAYLANKKYDSVKPYIDQSFAFALQKELGDLLAGNSNDLSEFFYETGMYDSAMYHAHKAASYSGKQGRLLLKAYEWLYKAYEKQDEKDSVAKYFRLAAGVRDSIFSTENNRTVQALNFQEELWEKDKQQAVKQAQQDYNHRLVLYSIFGALLIIIVIAALLYRNFQQQKKATAKVEAAYSELKSTQAQLIQSEKMASLGELTAGIAHEIQNPLNFVNNFSEVNRELISELVDEVDKGNTEEVKLIANDIKDNEEKINQHGKRADAIVKGMLQHSRQTKGIKEPTDINALCDEYLRLSYHGLRAKDKSFNADFKTDFDESIGKINIVPQDIGRVLLNLFNNAFYAVNEKSRRSTVDSPRLTNNYKPLVSIQTKKQNDKIEVKVSDNGNGIPQSIIDKIFQPFFTTKPTGQGTGLGLSLAHDIITKQHNGTIKAESKENEGSTFTIILPTA